MKRSLFLALIVLFTACSGESDTNDNNGKSEIENSGYDHIYAKIVTNKGEMVVDLAYEHAPVTVANFIALSEGYLDTQHSKKGESFYSGLTFHRVVPDFIIQGGDPLANGLGGPGYNIIDEFTELKHDRAGTLSMANSGPPNTGGSQFFITLSATPHLDGKHTVFGYVINGLEVAPTIEQGDVIHAIIIERVGASAEAFSIENAMSGNRR
jgi:peptidylprolyl isomerase